MSSRLFFTVGGVFFTAFLVLVAARSFMPSSNGTPLPSTAPTPTGYAVIVPPASSLLSGPLLDDPITSGTPDTEPQGTSTHEPVSSDPPPPTVLIEANWPPALGEGDSDGVAIWLVQTRDKLYVTQVERGGQTAIPATLVPRGTADVPYTQTFGSDYKLVSASAVLSAANFNIVAASDTTIPFPLDEARVGWLWNISPQRQGRQALNAVVRFRWESSSGEPKELTMWQYTLAIFVTPPVNAQQATVNSPTQPKVESDPDQVGFWADALQVITGLGAIVAFAGGIVKWGLLRAKGLIGG